MRGGSFELGECRPQPIQRSPVSLRRPDCVDNRSHDRLEVLNRFHPSGESHVLVGLQRGRLNLVRLVPKELRAALQLVRIHHELLGPRRSRAPCPPRLPDRGDKLRVASEAIEQRPLAIRGEQPLVLVLPVNLGDPAAECGEGADRDRTVVDPRQRSPVRGDLAADDERAVPKVHQLVERVLRIARDIVEDRLNAQSVGSAADQVAGASSA